MGCLAPVSLRTVRVWDLARSLGPISSGRGTPYNVQSQSSVNKKERHAHLSQSLSLYPGVYPSLKSALALIHGDNQGLVLPPFRLSLSRYIRREQEED